MLFYHSFRFIDNFNAIFINLNLFHMRFMEKPVSKLTGENTGTLKANRKKDFQESLKREITVTLFGLL